CPCYLWVAVYGFGVGARLGLPPPFLGVSSLGLGRLVAQAALFFFEDRERLLTRPPPGRAAIPGSGWRQGNQRASRGRQPNARRMPSARNAARPCKARG